MTVPVPVPVSPLNPPSVKLFCELFNRVLPGTTDVAVVARLHQWLSRCAAESNSVRSTRFKNDPPPPPPHPEILEPTLPTSACSPHAVVCVRACVIGLDVC